VLVVGGGATGAGTVLDAATRGLSAALIERGDFGCETSSRSTKLIWAGIRYVATAVSSLLRWRNVTRPIEAVRDFSSEFRMVLSAHRERRILLENNPHLTYWVPIAIPVSSWIATPAPFGHPLFSVAPLMFPAVFKAYDAMSGFTCPPSHVMGRRRARRKFPQLDEDVRYFQVFYEGAHNDARTNTYLALTAAQEGACVTNYTEMVGLLKDDVTGRAVGVRCRDNMTGDEFDVRAKAIVFAGGPFTDELRRMESPTAKPAVAAAAGTHIVLPGYYCPGGIGMLDINTSDGRFLFFLPWEGSTIVGTTDRKGPAVSDPEPPEEEIQWILSEVEKYLAPELKVRRADVLSAWRGFRPLASDPHLPPGAPVSRDHVVSTHPETGVTFITGGKWTTYRHMAEDVLDRVVELHDLKHVGPCVIEHLPLRGGEGYTRNVPIMLVQEFGVSEATAKHLARSYGMHAFEVCRMAEPTSKRWPRFGNLLLEGYPYLECEIEYACKNEMVCTVKDMLTLRMRLAYVNKEAALSIAPRVADLMAKSLGWSRKERNRHLKEAEELIQTFGGAYPNRAEDRLSFISTVSDVRDLFQTFDVGDTGYIDLTEFKDVAKMLGLSDDEASRTFKKIDKNKNGKITEDEFIDWWNHRSRDKLKVKLGEHFLVSRNNKV
jgi:glycerol-3-phosphate dehydrogenase